VEFNSPAGICLFFGVFGSTFGFINLPLIRLIELFYCFIGWSINKLSLN